MKYNFFYKAILFGAIFLIGAGFGHKYITKESAVKTSAIEKNSPRAFLSESYDKIKDNYWNSISDPELISLFKDTSSALGNPLPQSIETKDELVKSLNPNQAVKIISQVLANLSPTGRSGLYTQQLEQQLKNNVANVNPQQDLYKDLGLAKGASQPDVAKAYQKQAEDLQKQASPEAKERLKQLSYAKDVLSKDDSKQRYDNSGVEPTIFTKTLGNSLYLQFKKFSPTSLDEFQRAFDNTKGNANLDSLIFDLRGNIGGAIDETAYFLGFFIGKEQDAFDFYHQGNYLPIKTPTDKLTALSKFKQVVLLVDNQTQSSAEVMAAAFKKYHLGVFLGSTTKGWGTVERVFPLDNQFDKAQKYSIFLVHSVTLRDDNLPIEGRGVDPDIKLTDPNWQQQLYSYFRNRELISAVKGII